MKIRLTINGNGVYIVDKKCGLFSRWSYLNSFEREKNALDFIKKYSEDRAYDLDKEEKRNQIKVLKTYEIK